MNIRKIKAAPALASFIAGRRCFCLLLSVSLVASFQANSQVKEIGQSFQKTGYIDEINHHLKHVTINFITKEEIKTEFLVYNDSSVITRNKATADFSSLYPGAKVSVEGEFYPSLKLSKITRLRLIENDKPLKIDAGRIDGIAGDFAYIDGSKVKLGPKVQITGDKGSGYSTKKFSSFKELKLGDIAHLSGTYEREGYLSVTKMSVEPDIERDIDIEFRRNDAIHPYWSDKSKRDSLLGMSTPFGIITNSKSLQNYITSIGERLVPDYIKEKIQFIFVVVDNMEWNAMAMPSGLVIINTGLLQTCSNEAELAAVLGHEIAHAIYEHSANSKEVAEKHKGTKKTLDDIGKIFNKIPVSIINNKNNTIPLLVRQESYNLDTTSTNIFLSKLPAAMLDKSLSNYNIEQELQSDRVGLYLMVQAGYDPRAAEHVWLKQYNSSERATDNTYNLLLNTSDKILTEIYQLQKPNIENMGQVAANEAGRLSIENLKLQSIKTHPDNIARFEQLNKYINLFWASQPQLSSTQAYGERWIKALVEASRDLERSNWNAAYFNESNPVARIKLIDTAISRKYEPRDWLWQERAINNSTLGNFAIVLKDCDMLLKLNAKDDLGYAMRGNARRELNKKNEAVQDFTTAIKLNPQNTIAYFLRGSIKCEQKKFNEASADFIKVLEIEPENDTAKKLIQVCN